MSKKAYPCIGGPLDGRHAITDDFYEGPHHYEFLQPDGSWSRDWKLRGNAPPRKVFDGPGGMYQHLHDEYFSYNNADRSPYASMVFIHKSCLQKAIPPSQR